MGSFLIFWHDGQDCSSDSSSGPDAPRTSSPPVATTAAAAAERVCVVGKGMLSLVRQIGDGLCLFRSLVGAGLPQGDTKNGAASRTRGEAALELRSRLFGLLRVRQSRTRVHVAAPACCSTTFVSRPCSRVPGTAMLHDRNPCALSIAQSTTE